MKKTIADVLVSIGKWGSNLDINTNSPFIHFQGEIPSVIEKMRERKNSENDNRRNNSSAR
ncbi:MAG: hypothetical protein E7294_12805 [Lachnospiraceae bacterium]|nr:hypothetical protein [Lachnospiraceae bacterium]